jgi:hypothetical protein
MAYALFAADQGGTLQILESFQEDREVFMGFEDAGARQASGRSEAGTEVLELEGAAIGEADGVLHGITFGCSGCAEAGHCRRGLDQEKLASPCIGSSAPTEVW